ncbi:MAG: helicase-exonuclease AddAB subunit AddA [Lachnospiraceae bacterium]|nr:helicase-exonuclease AddAB subunit AddA [Lachnospiraceae bacterium]
MIKLTDEQRSVVDAKTSNILVSAAAGSGKTAVLVERILKKILSEEDPVDIDEILIVTFTNDAAAQMRDRIRRAIDDRLLKDPYNKRLQRESDRLSFANIMTLDSFCQHVVKRYFHQLDIDPGFGILDDTDKKLLLNRAITETIEEKHESGDAAFFQMLDAYSGSKDDAGIIELIAKIDDFSQSHPFPEEWIRDAVAKIEKIETEEDLLTSDFAQSEYEILRTLFESMCASFRNLSELCKRQDGPYFYGDGVTRDLAFCESAAGAKSLRDMILYAEDYYGGNTSIGRSKKDPAVDPELVNYVKNVRTELKALIDKSIKNYASEDYIKKMTANVRQCAGQLRGLCELTIACRKAYRALMDDQNAYDFQEIAHMTLQVLLKKEDGKIVYTDAARQYRRSFREIMVDEYQDSNLVQEMFLHAISREDEGQPNIFMVGDIKQSIYKFRMAKPELFMEKYETYSMDSDSLNRLIILNKNFRSRETILNGVNRVFRKIMQKPVGGVAYDEQAELKTGAEYKIRLTDEEAANEYILVHRNAVTDEQAALTGALVKRVKELTDPISGFQVQDGEGSHIAGYRDIAVLFKKSTGLMQPAIEALLAAGIPAYAADMKGYFDCTEVRNVLNFLKILDNPYSDIPFHAVLKSPMGGFTYEELALLSIYAKEQAKGGRTEYAMTLLRKLCAQEYVTEAMKTVRGKAEAFLMLYDSLKEKCSYLSVPELLTELYRESGYLSYVSMMPAGSIRERNLNVLVEKAKAFSRGVFTELNDFVRYIDDMKKYDVKADGTTSDAGNAIRFMTIHKSKGLEYPIVFVIDMEKEIAGLQDKSAVKLHAELGIGPMAIYPQYRYRTKSFPFEAVVNRNKIDEQGEALRLLYVAMTRAKEKLILLGGFLEKDWDKLIDTIPKAGEPLSFGAVKTAASYQKLLLPAILSEADDPKSVKKCNLMKEMSDEPDGSTSLKQCDEDGGCFVPQEIRAKEWTVRLTGAEGTAESAGEAFEERKEPVPAEMIEELREFFTFRYPFRTVTPPVKVSVSDLKKSAMEEYQTNANCVIVSWDEAEEKIPVPKFASLTEDGGVNPGAMRGTFYHRFLELHDYGLGDSEEELRTEAEKLAAEGYFPKELLEAVSFQKVSAFVRSEIGSRMKKAFLQGKLKREQAFVMSVPADAVSREYSAEESVLLQGIIDAMFEEEDGIVLLDYKTDRVGQEGGEELLKARYTAQLKYYAEAIARGTGKNVKESCIYSFALQKTIRL